MIKVGVIGIGSIGANHARIFSELKGVALAGVVDSNFSFAKKIASKYNCKAYRNFSEIIDLVDAVSIAVPTIMHYKIAMDLLKKNKDVLIEKPITSTVEEAEALISEAAKKNLILQVGHLERFNPCISVITKLVENPWLIEARRISPFPNRGTDVDVTLDLMIHDIDIILGLIKSDISELRATGSKVLTDNIDIAYAWLEFKNGCLAEIVASRIATEKIRQLKIFQRNMWFSLDYQAQKASCFRKFDGKIKSETIKTEKKEPLKEELASFVECVRQRTKPVVSGVEGKKALQIALEISRIIRNGN